MCQAFEGESRFWSGVDLREKKAKLQALIERADRGDEPTKEEWSLAMAEVLIAQDR